MSTSHQQTLADLGANERPPMLEKWNYIPWESRFRRFLYNKLEEGEWIWNLIQNGPYVRPMIPDPGGVVNINDNVKQILEPLSKMTEVDACKNAKEMWERIKRLLFGSDVTSYVRHSRLMDDKYVTMVRHNQTGETVSLVQLEPHVLASKAKKAAKNHDPLAIIAHSNASSSQSHANSSYSPQPYYVTHPSSVPQINTLYETFVPQQEFSVEQTYFSIPFTSNNSSKSKDVPSESPVLKMPNESRLLKMIDKLGDALTGLYTRINKTLLKDAERRWLSDSQNELRESYKTDVIPTSRSLYKNLKDIKEELIEEVQEMLNIFESMEQKVNEKSPTEILLQKEIDRLLEVSLTSEIRDCVLLSAAQQKHDLLKDELEKSLNDSKEIQANLLNRIKILENDFQRSQAQSIDFELKLQHQREKMACDVPWKSKLSTLNSENVLLKIQHQKEVDELIQCVTQKTYAYGDVCAENQDLLLTISELKSKFSTIERGKNVNTKFDSSKTLGKRVCVTPFNKHIADKAMNASSTKVNSDRSKPVTSQSTPKPEQGVGSSHSCVARHALSRTSSVKRALFTPPLAAKSKNLGATSVVTKSRLSVAKTPTATSKVIQLVLWIVDSGCSKHMTGNLQLLRNFIEKFMGTVRFGNDHFAAITGYGDYVQGNLTICHVYYVEGLGHNLFLVGQFCDGDLEVAFRSNTCYVQNLEGDDLLTGSRDLNLYTISISEMAASSPVCLMSRATSTKSWLWHRRLSHLNFGTINQLTSNDLVDGLPKLKYTKDHLCSACEQGKSKKASLLPKLVPSTESKLELLYMNLCGPMRVTSINGKKYILVIVDDYSRYTWVYFLRTKDKAPDMIINFVNQVQRNLKA
ncbi:integrase, catalytic region, zinc finger, CCHC-type containing protein [Tanacetum coccineum]